MVEKCMLAASKQDFHPGQSLEPYPLADLLRFSFANPIFGYR
jgi:hypothetical protein